MEKEEIWRPVFAFEGLYEVSNYGRIRNKKTGNMKVPTSTKKDIRPFVLLWRNNKPRMIRVHTIVLTAFIGQRPNGMECCHNDGNARNNNLENLRWDTPKNNHADKIRHGTTNRGERCGTAKLSLLDVRAIRADTRLQREIAHDYGVRQSAISRIKSGARWTYDH